MISVSGNSVSSFGSESTFESASTYQISATYDSSSSKVIVGYTDLDNSSYGTYAEGTISGTSISFGSPVVLNLLVLTLLQQHMTHLTINQFCVIKAEQRKSSCLIRNCIQLFYVINN